MSGVVAWGRYQKCPVCAAGLGERCLKLTGRSANGPVWVEADRPHGGRKERVGAVR